MMNYDEINRFLTNHPWFAIGISFVVVALCISVLFMNYNYKINTDQSAVKQAALVQRQKKMRTLAVHQTIGTQKLKELQKPLLKTLALVRCPVAANVLPHPLVPLCARCNVPLETVDGRQLFRCPVCKQQTTVQCPAGGEAMLSLEPVPAEPDLPGLYVCPVCKQQSMPNWSVSGAPLCPYCNNMMELP